MAMESEDMYYRLSHDLRLDKTREKSTQVLIGSKNLEIQTQKKDLIIPDFGEESHPFTSHVFRAGYLRIQ